MKLEYKRRAIYTVLSEVISEQDLLDTMWHWQNTYSEKSHFELNHFLSDCKNISEIASNRSWLYRKIIALLITEEKELKQDPLPLMLAYKEDKLSVNNDISNNRENWSEIFTTVMIELFSKLRSDTERSVSRYVTQHAIKLDLPQSLVHSLHVWTDKKETIDAHEADRAQLQKLLNLTYIALCEYIGPIKADLSLSNAIKEASFVHNRSELDARLLL
ncbi:MAG: hypothetical protein KBT75_09990 [Oleispira antarctica]|uniref:Uncharacterized protein n=1 Tax=Oleispira antarctica RB-8 TaxID=698738 RepID=R4YUZ2_OLEAN|nr:hypothetical protein [Oleispira antarctica]MBQ0793999.1 hypothetical protein [Oleispira antarctica]CCK77294.1 conserved hypothetical protein [Oleispira antarctica RB-8]|tara:strand:- start:177 stop:827 length:651 start_codon:yes stop_codon:yes gene_type:complete